MDRVLEFLHDVFPEDVLPHIYEFNASQTWGWQDGKLYSDLDDNEFFSTKCVDWINKLTGVNHTLYRCYRTMYLPDSVSQFHYDTHAKSNRTFLYYGHPVWDNSWGGETTFGEQEETYVKPKPNMGVYFSSKHWGHNVRPYSKLAQTMRTVYIWKLHTA